MMRRILSSAFVAPAANPHGPIGSPPPSYAGIPGPSTDPDRMGSAQQGDIAARSPISPRSAPNPVSGAVTVCVGAAHVIGPRRPGSPDSPSAGMSWGTQSRPPRLAAAALGEPTPSPPSGERSKPAPRNRPERISGEGEGAVTDRAQRGRSCLSTAPSPEMRLAARVGVSRLPWLPRPTRRSTSRTPADAAASSAAAPRCA